MQLVEFGKERAAAFNYHDLAWNKLNIAGLQRKLGIMLGFKHHKNRSLTTGIVKRGLKLISDEALKS